MATQINAYLAGACRGNTSEAFRVGSTNDHVHIACSLLRTLTISNLLEEIKKTSSMWMKKQDQTLRNFAWQSGYAVFSISQSQLPAVMCYIDNQPEHHRVKTYQEEVISL